ncbi:type II toxin-antitoxin system RelE family toxin [Desulfobacter latus]|uniref:Type II toxin-antitoxin system mRNA interferase toxin, RelE/StbE family n=1 Tax=Desulfobacter latus TaxID=2292 RepID=A0A850SUF7_9BACT|nr:type II toxin-antitoxin system mRNA interferase toxin, RelE/StbE family [Desulfobacter latus]NWH05004.1 type II toxin-antitoxin system mRNA interferase toxin, RelE/StbE family [Desulfobacter latus]
MTYKLTFKKQAKKEWDKLDAFIQNLLKKKLKERLKDPRVKRAELSNMKDCYKIKLRNSGYRLVYKVYDLTIEVSVIAVSKRDKGLVYRIAADRLQ